MTDTEEIQRDPGKRFFPYIAVGLALSCGQIVTGTLRTTLSPPRSDLPPEERKRLMRKQIETELWAMGAVEDHDCVACVTPALLDEMEARCAAARGEVSL